ncbi:glucosyltransferase [Neurospora sp. IMI 360204]|nr:glucosyltransferase [Neurospora sp. IMI 360204]
MDALRVLLETSTFITSSGFLLIYFFARSWLALVNHYAPEPYLDEVFHIPQAQTYCEGRYHEWDDKITTPPGLYLLSVGWHKLMRLAECTPSSLRSNNLVATLLTALLALSCRRRIEAQTAIGAEKSAVSFYAYHTAINIALFPVIFFFSGLYYTDVASTLVVLAAYRNHLNRVASHSEKPGFLNGLWTVVLGVAALFMRQTNVFWVVVYMGGLEVAHVVRGLKPKPIPEKETPNICLATVGEFFGFWLRRYAAGDVHDPPVDMAWPDDWALCLLSIGIAALCNPLKVLRQVWPHITVIGLFAGFVAWNGGVVLDETTTPSPSSSTKRSSGPGSPLLNILYFLLSRKLYYPLYLLATILLSALIVRYNTIIHPFTLADNRHYMFYIFRYTILRSSSVRLALVFAYTLSRWLVWKRLEGNNPPSRDFVNEMQLKNYSENQMWWRDEFSASPFAAQELGLARSRFVNRRSIDEAAGHKESSTTKTKKNGEQKKKDKEEEEEWLIGAFTTLTPSSSSQPSPSTSSPRTSTVLLWLLTTTLSLVTAPLVEPRYFILPWVFYRLLVPAMPVPVPSSLISSGSSSSSSSSSFASSTATNNSGGSGNGSGNDTTTTTTPTGTAAQQQQNNEIGNQNNSLLWNILRRTDLTLALETIWFLAINVGTMYMFLFKPFYWKTASGDMLDGGRVQRFMW